MLITPANILCAHTIMHFFSGFQSFDRSIPGKHQQYYTPYPYL